VSTHSLFTGSLVGWISAVLIALSARLTFLSSSLTGGESAAWVFAGCAPVVIALFFLRNRSSDSVAQVLYNAEHAAKTRTNPTVPRG
jgi:hypothetical protein